MTANGPQPDPICVRLACAGDLDALVRFNIEMARETEDMTLDPARLRRGVAACLDDPARGRYRVAERDGHLAGALMTTPEWSDWRCAWFWWIQSVYVPPAHRRRGVYRALHAAVIDEARRTPGVCGVRLYVHVDNARASQTYRALGMTRTHYDMFETELETHAALEGPPGAPTDPTC